MFYKKGANVKYDALLKPINVGNVELPNRMVMLPMTIEKADHNHIGDDLLDFYEQRAKGGAALIEIGSVYVCDIFNTKPKYPTTTGAIGAWDDEFIPGLKACADVVHKHGSKLAAQLQLCYEWRATAEDELMSYAPSKEVVSGPFVGMPEREFTKEEIAIVVKQYGEAARRCKDAGIDVIEIHAGIGYMVMRFISKYSNHRTDEYGGSTENRCRLLTEIIDEVHKTCGDDMPIIVRYSADDLMPGGQRVEDLEEVMKIVEAHGIDAWSIQAGFHEAPVPVANQFVPEGEFIYLSKAAKGISSLPCFPGTRINHLDYCEKVITEGSGDMVGMARHWIAEPEIVSKIRDGHPEQVRPCIVCSRCLDNIFVGKPCKCSVNANVFFNENGLPQDKPTDDPEKKILIVGAGVSGLECARTLVQRGYKHVTVVDKKSKPCGLINLAQVLNPELEYLTDWYRNEIERLSLDVRLNTYVTPEYIRDFGADEVILAVGPETVEPDVPGINRKNVIPSGALKELVEGHGTPGKGFMWSLSAFGMGVLGAPVGLMRWGIGTHLLVKKRIAIIGGGFAGLEVAHSMMEGRDVYVIEESKAAGSEIGIIDKKVEIRVIKEGGVNILTNTKLKEVTKQGIKVENTESGEVSDIAVDTVILSLPVTDNTALYEEMKGCMDEEHLHIIGNALNKRPEDKYEYKRCLEAVRDGWLLGMNL